MQYIEQWIGLPQALYPKSKHNIYSGFFYNDQCPYIVAEFQKNTFSRSKSYGRNCGSAAIRLLTVLQR